MSTGLTQVKKPVLDNALTYHRWLVGMDCRKDVLNQNQVINKRIVKKATPSSARLKFLLTSNKMRIAYFVGLCAFFSLDKVYDWLILDNTTLRNLNKQAAGFFIQKSKVRSNQNEIKNKIKGAKIDENKLKGLGNLFMQLDQMLVLDGAFMNRIGAKYDKDFVDIGSFIQSFKDEEFDSVIRKIRGEFPSLSLQI